MHESERQAVYRERKKLLVTNWSWGETTCYPKTDPVIFVGRDTQNNYDMVIELYIGMNTTRSI